MRKSLTMVLFAAGIIGHAWAIGTVDFQYRVIDRAIGHPQIGDIDADGHNDVILHVHKDDYHIHVKGRKTQLMWYQWPAYVKHTIHAGDFIGDRFTVSDINGDGNLDVVSGKVVESENIKIFWYQNPLPRRNAKHMSSWQEHLIGDYEGAIKDVLAGDIDNDGRTDIVVRGHDVTTIFCQTEKSWRVRKVGHPRKEGMDLADLDIDGDLDIILNGFWLETPSQAEKADFVRHNIDEKWYTQSTGSWQDNCCYVKVADINQDGLLDILLAHSENVGYPLSWYSVDQIGKVKTGPWREHKIVGEFDWCETVEVGDLDNDGDLDVLAAKFRRHDKPGSAYYNAPPYPVSVFYNADGDGQRWVRQDLANQGIYAGVLGDVGSDGDLDIVGPHSYWTGPIKMWENTTSDRKLSLDKWTYIQVDNQRGKWGDWDEPKWLKYFGLTMADITGDGYKDIVAGRYFYRNPGGNMTGEWQRVTFDLNVDGMLLVDVDGDSLGDVIAEALPDVFWLEARNRQGSSWKATKIGTLPKTGHVNGQGYVLGQIVPGGKPEIILAAGDGISYFEIPGNPGAGNWPCTRIAAETMDEGIGVGDVDRDGDIDIAAGKTVGESRMVIWYENRGPGQSDWTGHLVGHTAFAPDRIAIADMNGDKRPDVVVTEERWPGPEPDASLYWFEQPANPERSSWKRHTVVTEYSLNNLDVADMDRDGDMDIVICEHKGPGGRFKLQVFENDGRGNFTEHVLDRGKESHLGARVADMDGDGDFDIISAAWDNYRYLHLWRNDNTRETKR